MTAQCAVGAGLVPAAQEWQEDPGPLHTGQPRRARDKRAHAWQPGHLPVDELILLPKHNSCADQLTFLGHTVLFEFDLLCFFGYRSTSIRCLFAGI